jgi:hypothetical protein
MADLATDGFADVGPSGRLMSGQSESCLKKYPLDLFGLFLLVFICTPLSLKQLLEPHGLS